MNLRFRLLALAYGAALLVWFGLEDQNTWTVTLLGVLLAGLLTAGWMLRQYHAVFGQRKYRILAMILSGGIIGAGSSLATVFLMFFKNAWHAHIFPDYPTGLMIATLERLPVWSVAGALLGLAVGLLWRVRHISGEITPD